MIHMNFSLIVMPKDRLARDAILSRRSLTTHKSFALNCFVRDDAVSSRHLE